VYTRAVCTNGSWRGTAIVVTPGAKVNRQVKRIETVPDFLFMNKQDAQEFAFELSKRWIDTVNNRTASLSPRDWRVVARSPAP
jgi:hypothetical protein